jgi:hypothetical protein
MTLRTIEDFQRNPAVNRGVAALILDVTPTRVQQLISSRKLDTVSFFGSRLVLASSIASRLSKRPFRRREANWVKQKIGGNLQREPIF